MASRKAVNQRQERETHRSRKAPVMQKRPRWRMKPRMAPTMSPVRMVGDGTVRSLSGCCCQVQAACVGTGDAAQVERQRQATSSGLGE